jgi:ankyrin repeat protein
VDAANLAALAGHAGGVRALCERGAAVDATDSEGKTPVQVAANSNQVDCVHALVKFGATLSGAELQDLQEYVDTQRLPGGWMCE